MIAFPRRGLTMSKTGDIITIKMTEDPDNSDFEYMAHRRGDTQKDVFYVGAYLGYVADNKLRSLSGKTPSVSITLNSFRNYAHNLGNPDGNGGSGYDTFAWYQLLYLQCMYVLKYKNLDSQATIGIGKTNNSKANTGGTATKGMDWGDRVNTNQQVKLFGIEDLWGNYWRYVDGFWYSSDYHIWTTTDNFNDSATGYTDRGASGYTQYVTMDWITKIFGDTHLGFLRMLNASSNGSATTYYCDSGSLKPSCIILYGGGNDYSTYCGIFFLQIREGVNYTTSLLTTRLMYF